MSYNVGSRVFWYSQGGGISKRKEGEVVEVVQPNVLPATLLSRHVAPRLATRKYVSYVVLADNGEKYFPIASKLQPLSTAASESSGAN